jgi:hypothetical protein
LSCEAASEYVTCNSMFDLNKFSEELDQLIKQHALAVEKLTQQQLAEAIKQAIVCGDFQRFVHHDAQQVVYIPFAREAELVAQIDNLKRENAKLLRDSLVL